MIFLSSFLIQVFLLGEPSYNLEHNWKVSKSNDKWQYQPRGTRGTCPLPIMLHRLQNPKWPSVGPKIANGVWKGGYTFIFLRFSQLSLNKFFDSSTPSMRKINNEETGKQKTKQDLGLPCQTSIRHKIVFNWHDLYLNRNFVLTQYFFVNFIHFI